MVWIVVAMVVLCLDLAEFDLQKAAIRALVDLANKYQISTEKTTIL